MAWTTINYTCGHSVEVQMYGPHAERDRRAEAKGKSDCPDCRAKGSDLTGSAKQIAWAIDIRATALPKAEAAHAEWTAKLAASAAPEMARVHVQAALDAKIAEIRARSAARDWIDHQQPELEVYEAMRLAMTEAKKLAR